jgi:hypothetical protein
VEDSLLQGKTFDLGIWHPLALPADKQNRAGYQMLHDVAYAYPSSVSRSGREEAINAVQAFVDEAKDLVAALEEDSDFFSITGPLHLRICLSPNAGARTASAIAQSAQRHGLACYDPQSDTLTLPPPFISGETQNLVESSKQAITTGEQAITIPFGPWTIRAYVAATRRCYMKIKESGSDRCGCDNCENFTRVRDQAYPPEVLTVFDLLGVDFRKESEVHYYGRTPAGRHTYRGWLYLVGSIEHGPESWHNLPDKKTERRFHRFGPSLEIGLGKKSDYGFSEWETVLIAAGFADGPCVEIDFYADLPWLSDAPEPDKAKKLI